MSDIEAQNTENEENAANDENTSEDHDLTDEKSDNDDSNSYDDGFSDDDPPDDEGVWNNRDLNHQPPEIQELRQWSVLNRIKNTALDDLLVILGRRLLPTIPKTAKTLLQTTKASYSIEPMTDSKGRPGEFVYFGIKKQMLRHLNPEFHKLEQGTRSKLVEIDVNVDGLKVFKSSKKDAWVISCRIVDKFCLYKPFTIAVYYGQGKPHNINEFLMKFVQEIIPLSGCRGQEWGHGFMIDDQHYKVKLRFFICDTPARSALKATKGHTGYYSCERCVIKGQRQNHTTVFLPNECHGGGYENRTDGCDPQTGIASQICDDQKRYTNRIQP